MALKKNNTSISTDDFNLLIKLYKSKQFAKAEVRIKEMISQFPNDINLHNLLGIIFFEKKELNKAIAYFKNVLAIKPDYAEAHNNIGNVLREQKNFKEAMLYFRKALEIKPKFAEAYNNIGILFKNQEQFEKAILHYRKSISIMPKLPNPYNNIGNALRQIGNFDEAVRNFNKAIEINPNFADAYNNLALTLQKQKKYDQALACYAKAIKINPDFHDAKYNLGYLQLAIENFAEGWKNHEYRKSKRILTKNLNLKYKKFWNGKKFKGKLLIYGEQGLGDQIMFSSMLSELLALHDDISVSVEERLLPLFRRSFKGINFINNNRNINNEKFDKYTFIGSLGMFFRKSINDFPKKQKPLLIADSKKIEEIKKYLGKGSYKKIGISWKTSSPNARKNRSIPLKLFKKILNLNKYRFVDLQYGETLAERSEIKNELNIDIFHIDNIDYKNDIESLAAIISQCDIVITIPNFTTQLAAALGVPVFVLLPYPADWRWFLNRDSSPWYSNIKLFRQKNIGQWNESLKEVYNALKD